MAGIRVDGHPHFALTARRWTTEHLAAARHSTDLQADGYIWLNLDRALHGLGTASCGPGVLPQYRLHAQSCAFALTLTRSGHDHLGATQPTRPATPPGLAMAVDRGPLW
jgi:beta-galactosidase